MNKNSDLLKNAYEHSDDLQWLPSPAAGVHRKMLDRDGDEVARATSLVKYAPGVSFPEHKHDGGEEFLVLEGTFSDEHGDYPQGTYVRNPVGSKHSPFSREGCTILVKLRQMHLADENTVRINYLEADWASVGNFEYLDLYSFGSERVSMLRTKEASIAWSMEDCDGLEFYVISGQVNEEDRVYEAGTWIRRGPEKFRDFVLAKGSLVWFKTGHLPKVDYMLTQAGANNLSHE